MVQMCIEYSRFDDPSKPRCIINFCKLGDVPRFIITRICKPQIRQKLAFAIPSILCKRAHDALDTVLRLRYWRADALHRGVITDEASLHSAVACRFCVSTRSPLL